MLKITCGIEGCEFKPYVATTDGCYKIGAELYSHWAQKTLGELRFTIPITVRNARLVEIYGELFLVESTWKFWKARSWRDEGRSVIAFNHKSLTPTKFD